jgi:hypothetical protein
MINQQLSLAGSMNMVVGVDGRYLRRSQVVRPI